MTTTGTITAGITTIGTAAERGAWPVHDPRSVSPSTTGVRG
jgi:hypothetical protein